jgi:SAM-dependent methyltransferase
MSKELWEIRRRTRALYDHRSPDYAERTRNYELFPGLNDEIDRFLTLSLSDLPLVDLGCGPGRDCLYLLERGWSVVAVDISGNMIEATATYCDRHPRLGLVQADISHTPFRDASFGGAWVCASLLHLPSEYLASAVTEIGRILAPGAGVAISMKAGHREGWHVGRTLTQQRWFTFVDPEEFAELMRRCGFTAVSIKTSGRRDWFVAEGRWVSR